MLSQLLSAALRAALWAVALCTRLRAQPQLKPLNFGMIATGNHGHFDSLRGAPPLWKPPPHCHPTPENVPIFGRLHR